MFREKKAVLFDLDGTLIDSVGVWNEVDRTLIRRIGGGEAPDQAAIQRVRDAVLRAARCAPDPYLAYCAALKESYATSLSTEELVRLRYEIAQDYLANRVDYKPDAHRVLRRLRDCGLTLAIVSTTKRSNLEIYRRVNRNILEKAPLDDYISAFYTREDAREIKPSPEIYGKVLGELGLSPADCLVFEDSLVGVEAANRAGIQVAVMYDSHADHERPQLEAQSDYQFQSYAQVLRVIEQEFPAAP